MLLHVTYDVLIYMCILQIKCHQFCTLHITEYKVQRDTMTPCHHATIPPSHHPIIPPSHHATHNVHNTNDKHNTHNPYDANNIMMLLTEYTTYSQPSSQLSCTAAHVFRRQPANPFSDEIVPRRRHADGCTTFFGNSTSKWSHI